MVLSINAAKRRVSVLNDNAANSLAASIPAQSFASIFQARRIYATLVPFRCPLFPGWELSDDFMRLSYPNIRF
jgi:hypothetical protein